MIEVDEGHDYRLRCLDGHSALAVRLVFVKREGAGYPGNVGRYPGTTSQEVLRALIARAQYVNWQIPAWQTRVGIALMRAVIWLFEHRAARRHGRRFGLSMIRRIEQRPTCMRCGHIGCEGHLPTLVL